MEKNKLQPQTPPLHPPTSDPNSQFTIQSQRPPSGNSQFTFQTLALILLIALYLLTAFAYAALAPLTIGPDELAHYEYVRFIAGHGRLPINNEERTQASYKSDQPPLYHLLAALPAALVDPTGPPSLKRVGDTPRRQLIERTRHAWGLYNTEDERWPYRAEILRWQVGRWVAILFGAATVLVTFFIAREVVMMRGHEDAMTRGRDDTKTRESVASSPPRLMFPVLAAAVVAFIPRFGLTGAMLNYETTVAFFSALFLWVLLRVVNSEWRMANERMVNIASSPHRLFHTLLLGLFAGLAILSKLSAVILLPEIIVALWLIARAAKAQDASRITHHASRITHHVFRQSLLALAAALAVLSLWFGFVLYHFNTIAQDGLWVGLLRPLIAADSSDATTNQLLSVLTGGEAGFTGAIENLESGPPWQWAATMFRTFWMVGIETVQPLASVAPALALAFCLLAAYGLISMTADPFDKLRADRRPATGDRSVSGLATQPPISNLQSPISNLRLFLSLLALHLFMPLLLPLLRYAVTFSLADTAQGRHVLFLAAPAFAILLIWGIEAALSRISMRQRDREAEEQQAKARNLLRRKSASAFTRFSLWLTDYISYLTPHASRLTHRLSHFAVFLPILLLLAWTAAHLWAMTWAYLPPLPVSTLPEARAQAGHTLNKSLNKFVTLAGYSSQLDPAGRTLRLDLIWQATALSPTDYLTEVTLLDSANQPQAQWLGYTAGGRYPTRAWDVGDIVRDTVWLPTAGLAPGVYHLSLNLIPTSRIYPDEAETVPFTLADLTLPDTALRTFNSSLAFTNQAAAAAGYSVWQDGQALTVPREFRYRETVLVTFSPLLPNQRREVRMVGPEGSPSSAPIRELNNTALFIVGPDWSSGKYHLQVSLTSPAVGEQQVNSSAVLTVVDRWQRQFIEPPLTNRIEANFADQVKLLGYTLGANRAEPGGGIPLTLVWQGLDWLGQDYTIFTKLIKADDQTVYGGRDRLPQEGYRTLYWAPGEIVTDAFGVPVEAHAPPGVYYLHVGLYQQVGQQAVSLPLIQNGQPVDATAVIIGPVKVGGPPPGAVLTTAQPQTQVNQSIGDGPNVTLLGYDLGENNCQQSTGNCQLSITLYWRSESPLPVDYTAFVHLRNAAGETVAQKDQPPLEGAYPTSLWDPGEIIADTISIPLPAGLPADQYAVVVGMYDYQTGQRLAIPGQPANEITLTHVNIR